MTIHPTTSDLLKAVLHEDLPSFIGFCATEVTSDDAFMPNWHIDAMAHRLRGVMDGKIKKLLVTMPPRSLKSISTSVAFPAYVLGHNPKKSIVCVSYSDELAAKHARDCRRVMSSALYRKVFPGTVLSRTKNAELDFETTRRGGRISTSVGGTLTGRGGSLIIVDDPQKSIDAHSQPRRKSVIEWFGNTLSTRLNRKEEDAIIVVMQRLHVDDLAGHLISSGDWDHLNLPAIAVTDEEIQTGAKRSFYRKKGMPLHGARESLEALEQQKRAMGTYEFNAQYQQDPVPPAGNLIKKAWLQTYKAMADTEDFGRTVQSWDFAVKEGENNDWTVCLTARIIGNKVYVRDVFRQKLDYPAQRKAVFLQAQKHRANVILIEAAANGSPLVADLCNLNSPGIPTPIAIKPKGSKEFRLSVQSHRIEAGDLRLPENAPWKDEFETELLAFPNGRHDDQVDTVSQLLAWIERRAQSPFAAFEGCEDLRYVAKVCVDGEQA